MERGEEMNIGERMLDMPEKTSEGCQAVFKLFGLSIYQHIDSMHFNAVKLVELNNEVYEKLHPKCRGCGCNLGRSEFCYDCG